MSGGHDMQLRFAFLVVLVGCSGSTAQISEAQTFGGEDAATTIDGAIGVGRVDAASPADAEPTRAEDAGAPRVDAGANDAGSLPVVDASVDAPAAVDATPPTLDAAGPLDAAAPVDAGPTCTPIADKTACRFNTSQLNEYSHGIADDGCGSYYDCSASYCGVRVVGTSDAGPDPNAPYPCATASFTGWEYECYIAAQVTPTACVALEKGIMCCPIPKNGQPFSKVIY